MTEQTRTSRLKKHIVYSFLLKGWAGVVQLLLVSATIGCLGDYKNGIWMTIASILFWIDNLDIGLGNGLRNTLARYVAEGNMDKARESVSTTFFMLILLIIPILLATLILVYSIDINRLLGVDTNKVSNLFEVLAISICFICATFVFKFIGNLYLGLQLPAVNNGLIVLGQTLILIGVWLLNHQGVNSLKWVAVVYTLSPLLIYILAYLITFYHKYPDLKPRISDFRYETARKLLSFGLLFFVLQITGVILFATSNIIISKLLSPELVTPYQVCYRYYSVVLMIFTVIGVPFWSATTDAFTRKDFSWIRKAVHNMLLVLLGLTLLLAVMVAMAPPIYTLWIGKPLNISATLNIGMACYILIIMVSLSYSYILNGIGKLHLQIVCAVCAAIVFVPLASWLCLQMGLVGMILSLCLVNIPGMICNMIQYKRIMNNTAKGIWRK